MKKQLMHRSLFCAYWLYFNAFRLISGGLRFLDYIGMTFLLLGLLGLISKKKVSSRLVMKVLMMFTPIIISAIVDPNVDVLFFLLKMYIVALYFVCYFKSMRLTSFELACITFPAVISVYYLFNPVGSSGTYYLESRLSGIGDPNFTSLSFIISMCSAFGIYILTKKKFVKLFMMIVICFCCWGVLLTASRAGFIGIVIALCLFLVIKKVKWYAFPIVIVVVILIVLNWDTIIDIINRLFIFERFQAFLSSKNSLIERYGEERYYTKYAWDAVLSGDWFIGGGPRLVIEWAEIFRNVPHNSFLDIGLAFGKASFYFYSGLVTILIIINVISLAANRLYASNTEKDNLIASVLFLSLIPMYNSLSVGLTMSFALWMCLGAYPLLQPSSELSKILSKILIFRRIRIR